LGKNDENEPISTKTSVKLTRSSFMLEPRSAVIDTGIASDITSVTAGYCVFAAVGKAQSTPPANPFGTILNLARHKQQDGQFTFSFSSMNGQKNAYYRVNPVAVSSGSIQAFSFEECKGLDLPVEDRDAVTLAKRPWHSPNPFDIFEKEPWAVFGLEIATEPALFIDKDPTVIGAQFYFNGSLLKSRRAYPEAIVKMWPPAKPSSNEPVQKVWYPAPKKDEVLPPGTDSELSQLLRTTQPGEVILIKHNGLLPMPETVELKPPRAGAPEFKVTFKAAPGFKPVLTTPVPPKPGESLPLPLEQCLFRLMSGEVSFEGIQFLLKPSAPKNPFKVAAVSIVGGRGCTFTDCVFTLTEEDDQITTVVRVADPDKLMMAMTEGSSRPIPEINFKQSVIRGKGRGVWIEVSRAVKIDLSQTLVALNGPMILTESAGKSVSGARSTLKLSRVTAFAGGPLVEMKAGKIGEMRVSGLVPFEVHAEECMFAGVPGAGKPLVELDGIEPDDLKSVLEWHATKNGNRYANFEDGSTAIAFRPGGDVPQKDWDWLRWTEFVGEPPGKPMLKLMFERSPTNLTDLPAITRKDVALPEAAEMKLDDVGANWKALAEIYSSGR
jgi:hypothetical protein